MELQKPFKWVNLFIYKGVLHLSPCHYICISLSSPHLSLSAHTFIKIPQKHLKPLIPTYPTIKKKKLQETSCLAFSSLQQMGLRTLKEKSVCEISSHPLEVQVIGNIILKN